MAISIKAARVNRGLTQIEAAKRLGINKSTLQKWESGKCFPNAKKISLMCELYDVKIDDLIFCLNITLKA